MIPRTVLLKSKSSLAYLIIQSINIPVAMPVVAVCSMPVENTTLMWIAIRYILLCIMN